MGPLNKDSNSFSSLSLIFLVPFLIKFISGSYLFIISDCNPSISVVNTLLSLSNSAILNLISFISFFLTCLFVRLIYPSCIPSFVCSIILFFSFSRELICCSFDCN